MLKSLKEQSVRPEGQDFSKNIIFEVLTLCGSNRFKKFLIVSEKLIFLNITFHGNASRSESKMLASSEFP